MLGSPLVADPAAPLARAHPLAKLGAALVLMFVLFVSVDAVTSGLILAAVTVALPFGGLGAGPLARRLGPLALAAAGIGLFNALFSADPRGVALLAAGPLHLTDRSLAAGAAVGLRIAGIAATGILCVGTIDPTDLADALVQHLRASPRFVVGALAAWRLAPLFGNEWIVIGLARRARGIEADRGPLRIAAFPGRTFTLLVGAIRRATRLALAMDARGFGQRPCRTVARPRAISRADIALVAGAVAVALAATAISVALGTWRPLLGG